MFRLPTSWHARFRRLLIRKENPPSFFPSEGGGPPFIPRPSGEIRRKPITYDDTEVHLNALV